MSFFSVFKTLSLLAVFSNVIMMCFLSFLSMDFVFCLKFVELFFPNLFLNKFIYLFLVVLGLHCCVGTSLVAVSRGYFLLQCMTNLDSIFKSRDITLPTNVHLVKAVVFPVVMYGVRVGL